MTPLSREPFRLEGQGGAAVLVHGLGGGPYELQWLGEALHARLRLTVQAILLPGHETKQTRMPASRHEDWCAAVEAALERLPGPTHVVGFSTGATVALRVAERAPPSGRLVLLAPFVSVAKPKLLPVTPEALLQAFSWVGEVPRRGPPLADAALKREVTRCLPFLTFNLDATRSALTLAKEAEAEAASLRSNTLVLQGARDTVVDPAASRRLAQAARARFVELPQSDHLLSLDVERGRVEDEVVDFLR